MPTIVVAWETFPNFAKVLTLCFNFKEPPQERKPPSTCSFLLDEVDVWELDGLFDPHQESWSKLKYLNA